MVIDGAYLSVGAGSSGVAEEVGEWAWVVLEDSRYSPE